MMRISSLFSAFLVFAPVAAFAQGEEADAPPADAEAPAPDAATDPAAAPPPAEAVAPVAASGTERFQIRRGLHAELDLGVFFTFGGINNNSEAFLIYDPNAPTVAALPKKAISNVQPLLALFFGYDVVHSPDYALALGLRFVAAYSGGASRLSQADVDATRPNSDERKTLATRANDYGIIQTGAGVSFGYLLTDRIALTVKADGGLAIIAPDPVATAGEANGGASAFSGAVGGGLGMEYFTLLNDFSVGLDLHFSMIFAAGGIPSLGISIPVKYTF